MSCDCHNKLPQAGELKQENVFSHSSGSRKSEVKVWAGGAPCRHWRGESALCFFQLLVAVALTVPASASPSHELLCVSQISLGLFLTRTFIVGFQVHLGNPEAIS